MIEEKDLEEIYKMYPRKLGKTPGMKKARKDIKTVFQLDDLRTAILNYKNYIKRNEVQPQYVMYFSTFMNQWEDWLDPKTGAVEMEVGGFCEI